MARKAQSRPVVEESEDPPFDVPEPRRASSYEPSHVIQLLVELQKQTTAIDTKLNRAISDLEKVDDKIAKLSSTMTWVKGFGAGMVLLIPLCAAVVWWFVGDNLTQMKVQLIQATKQPPIVIPGK